ncbi:hypothetical protein Dcar01_01897 [Deinococcus carri]|uniref:Uncharacterized protein n=1 Tax=Deinococcus carri TaxID=1211323 RepID=A0ABP9W867_9DEIO
MDISREKVVNSLKPAVPQILSEALIDEYISIKRSFRLGHFSPTELAGGRFGEVLVRIFEHLRTGTYTPLGTHLTTTNSVINAFESDGTQEEFFRFFTTKACRILMGVRNKRNVAHLANNIDPNFQDSLLVMELATWIFSEMIRSYSNLSISESSNLIASINYQHIPIIEEIGGFPKILRTDLSYRDKTLLLLYAKYPQWVDDKDLKKWTGYSNATRFRTDFLEPLSRDALTHRQGNQSLLTSKGIAEVERSIELKSF